MSVKPLVSLRNGLSTSRFVQNFQLPRRPGHFQGLLTTEQSSEKVVWPALKTWSTLGFDGQETLDGLKRPDTQNLIVPVEVSHRNAGYNAGASKWDRIELPFSLFLDAFIQHKIPWQAGQDAEQQRPVGYLAQYDLLSKSPSLASEAPGLPHTTAGPKGAKEQWRSNVWIGPAGTYTPLHRDPYENLFAQVVGRKRIHLFPPELAPCLYINKTGPQRNTSAIASEQELIRPAEDRPLLQQALASDDAFVTELGPGDVVYIPQGWFHCVQSLSTSASVNFWYL
ncbi:uncharacterized protein MEPE_05887 [Melanopsichium pennsylvanicum]|uniref:JmjC domain-containing protein n=2 Tax=Melanopsichium pennsylvanicum TaxID=63383 RepID=A0AAJ4XSR0_9BASI|nr:conserved hypothetical protein (N-terminal fragment) [Melanopsichium pennsylvanicum 4]SNX87177.1 uncharacterized protein MEPE_05887 [Melanopsichium pennsylvanicum]